MLVVGRPFQPSLMIVVKATLSLMILNRMTLNLLTFSINALRILTVIMLMTFIKITLSTMT